MKRRAELEEETRRRITETPSSCTRARPRPHLDQRRRRQAGVAARRSTATSPTRPLSSQPARHTRAPPTRRPDPRAWAASATPASAPSPGSQTSTASPRTDAMYTACARRAARPDSCQRLLRASTITWSRCGHPHGRTRPARARGTAAPARRRGHASPSHSAPAPAHDQGRPTPTQIRLILCCGGGLDAACGRARSKRQASNPPRYDGRGGPGPGTDADRSDPGRLLRQGGDREDVSVAEHDPRGHVERETRPAPSTSDSSSSS